MSAYQIQCQADHGLGEAAEIEAFLFPRCAQIILGIRCFVG